jgi:hypothetical protein
MLTTQGGNTYRITPFQAGSPYQGPTAPVNPFINQMWWDTASTPAELLSWNGTNWVPFASGFLDVRGFGVAGDGTDVSAPLQALLNNTAVEGCLYFPEVTPGYALGSVVTVPTGTCFVGDPVGSRIYELPSNTTGLFIMSPVGSNGARLTATDIVFDGNRSAGATGDCIATDPTIGARMSLNRVVIKNCAGRGVFLSGSSSASHNVQIYNSVINSNGLGIAAQYLTNFNIIGNLILSNDGPGLQCGYGGVGYCTQGAISGGNIFTANGCVAGPFGGGNADNLTGQLEAVADVTISNNVSQSSCGEGIQFGGSRSTISGNHLIGNQQNGIFTQSIRLYTTGTISVISGGTSVIGIGTGWAGVCPNIQAGQISNTGTRLQTSTPPGNAVTGGGSRPGVLIKSINSNTSMTLSVAWPGSTLVNSAYTLVCPVPVVSPVIAANTIQGVTAGWNGIFVNLPAGGTITGNSADDSGGQNGIYVTGDSGGNGLTISANTVSNKTGSGISVDSSTTYSTGTVTATSGSPTVTLAGGSFDVIPGITWFRATGDTVAYQVTAQTSSTLTLGPTNYGGTTGSGKAYVVQSGVSAATNISGNSSRLNNIGVNLAGCWACAVSGGANNNNTTWSVLESNASNHNILAGFIGGQVSVVDANTQYLSTGNGTSIRLGNLPITPGSKQPVCVDTTTNILYRGSAGTC